MPSASRIRVDLPAPFKPTRACTSPQRTSMVDAEQRLLATETAADPADA